MGYIDDSYLQGDTVHECQTNVTDTCGLFTKLGFIIHPVKSVLRPAQILGFLGFVLNSVSMTVCLPTEKAFRIKEWCIPAKFFSICKSKVVTPFPFKSNKKRKVCH